LGSWLSCNGNQGQPLSFANQSATSLSWINLITIECSKEFSRKSLERTSPFFNRSLTSPNGLDPRLLNFHTTSEKLSSSATRLSSGKESPQNTFISSSLVNSKSLRSIGPNTRTHPPRPIPVTNLISMSSFLRKGKRHTDKTPNALDSLTRLPSSKGG